LILKIFLINLKNKKRKREKTMKITVNGLEISGTTEQVCNAAKQYGWQLPADFKGDDQFYLSDSKSKLIRISDMNEVYIKNAFLKIYRKWVEDLSKVKDLKELAQMIKDGPVDPVCVGLYGELLKRVEEGK
jgi:hypothetical protein